MSVKVEREPYTLKMLRAKYDLTQSEAGKRVGVFWRCVAQLGKSENVPECTTTSKD